VFLDGLFLYGANQLRDLGKLRCFPVAVNATRSYPRIRGLAALQKLSFPLRIVAAKNPLSRF